MARKGIILAGGSGSRLWPLTVVSSKQLLPIYDKPMIYYALTTLMLAGLRDILLITTADEQSRFRDLLHDGDQWGIRVRYAVQPNPDGIARAFLIGEEFIAGDACTLILGDNVFFGAGLSELLCQTADAAQGAAVFCHWVKEPGRYGVMEFDGNGHPAGIEEKPAQPRSNWAVTGLYFYDRDIVDIARCIRPSRRGEYEITDINRIYLEKGALNAHRLGRGFAWFDAGTPSSLLQASEFMYTIEERQGLKIGCPEEVAYRMGYIDAGALARLAGDIVSPDYSAYLRRLLSPVAQ